MITGVTITGADDSIRVNDLFDLANDFPFFEPAILVSATNFGKPRYPSRNWLYELLAKKRSCGYPRLAMHLCGKYARLLADGDRQAFSDLWWAMDYFERIQINTHNIPTDKAVNIVELLLGYGKEFIFQYDEVNHALLEMCASYSINATCLFDGSGGRGLLPTIWPKPLDGIECGYAGGLGPHNLRAQIEMIEATVGDTPVWLDMETHVRSNDNKQFDLDKVRQCLQIASEYIQIPELPF